MIELGVNIDHVATVRQARRTYEPDPVWAAAEAELGGADGITIHLREDRRHIQDRDVELLKQTVHVKLNLEMSLADEIVDIACRVCPQQVSLVPERREEVTTEGGLDVIAQRDRTRAAVDRLRDAGIVTSAFIDPDPAQVATAHELGFNAVELHTGAYANATGEQISAELNKLIEGGARAVDLGLRLHAGHGLNYHNTTAVASIDQMAELNIGHSIISRAVFVGLRQAVREMKDLLRPFD
ncbi:MAG: pyridoxine 5'-phosphate synthase [Planctomycetaceae bacterium]|nr:pyridoxine 5'-phosphate synthase [Planctomycetaceae bacterium]